MLTDLWPAVVALALLTLTPGADTLIVMRNASRGGARDGIVTSLGICCALFMHALVSAAGLSVVLMQSAVLFNGLKLLGAAYLIWLGIGSLREAWKRQAIITTQQVQAQTFTAMRSFREGFLSNALNPKAVIFYMAFLPQFINPNSSPLQQSLVLCSVHFGLAMGWQSLLALMIGRARQWLTNPNINRVFNGLTGSLLLTMGFGLMMHRI